MGIRTAIRRFIATHIVADDPAPEPSRLDVLDGRIGDAVYEPMHDDARMLHRALIAGGRTDIDGEPLTLRRVDHALQAARESLAETTGMSVTSLESDLARAIILADALASFGIPAEEVPA